MNQCSACQQHFYARESACPHCQAPAPANPVRRWADHVRKSGILLFAALTTTACYGTPPYPGVMPKPLPGTEQPLKRVPTTLNTAYFFVSGSGSLVQTTLQLQGAVLSGNHLELHGSGASAFNFVAQAKAQDAFTQKGNIFDAVQVSDLDSLTLDAYDPTQEAGTPAMYQVRVPGDDDVTGTVQLSSVDDKSVAGTLLIQKGQMVIEVYFWAARQS
jgi:hypothetical protein